MGKSGDSDSRNKESCSESAHEKGNSNKRKYLSEGCSDVHARALPSSLKECCEYKLLEEKLGKLRLSITSLDQPRDEEVKDYLLADWNDPIARQFEELLMENVHATFRSAMKKIAESGYTEEVAEQAILRCGFSYGVKDHVSNIVECALSYLREDKGSKNNSRNHLFENMQNLVEYTMLEMVNVVMEIKPSLSVAEVMWCLLICDLNLSKACEMEADFMKGFLGKERTKEMLSDSTQTKSKPELQASKAILPTPGKPKLETPLEENSTNLFNVKFPVVADSKSLSLSGGHIQTISQTEDALGVARKCFLGSSKRDMHRQRTLHMERCRSHMCKGAFKNKFNCLGGLLVEKKQKPSSPDSFGANVKNASSKKILAASNKTSPTSSSPVVDAPAALPVKDTDSKVPKPLPSLETKLTTDPQNSISPPSSIPDYLSGIPYDESKGQYMPQNEKDKLILALVAKKQALETEFQGWTDWTNEKIMQATQRLNKDKEELKALRQEREEAEKVSKEKQLLVENSMKRITEMERALGNATRQIDVANSSISKLEQDNLGLKKEMEAAKSQALVSAKELQDAVIRELETTKKVQSCDSEKGLMLEELASNKRQVAELRKVLDKSKGRYDQSEALRKQEEKEKEKLQSQASIIRKEREQLEAEAKEERDKITQRANYELQRCKDNIKTLEEEISKLRMRSESSKIAQLRRGIGWNNNNNSNSSDNKNKYYLIPNARKRLPVFQEISKARKLKQDRECIMCMSEDISVIFLPCAHQLLCENCSKKHEQQGMNDCPSCRALIQMRFTPRFVNK